MNLETWLTARLPHEEYRDSESETIEAWLITQGFNLYRTILEDYDSVDDVVIFLQKETMH